MDCEMCYLREATKVVGTVPICDTCIIDQDVDPREAKPIRARL